jgi:hypothetical protein
MSQVRYEQIKRFFHIYPVTDELPTTLKSKPWVYKIEPLYKDLRRSFQRYYLPASTISIDEMIVGFKGKSANIVKMPRKPTSEGYKIYALCDSGYTYNFLFTGREEKVIDLVQEQDPEHWQKKLFSQTSSTVLQLVKALPKQRRWQLYMDNYFCTAPLFRLLRARGIGACGTTRISPKDPAIAAYFKQSKPDVLKALPWGDVCGSLVENGDVLLMQWIDQNVVSILTTIHLPSHFVVRPRRKPKATSSNAAAARAPFEPGESRKDLPVPAAIDDYNKWMGGVDIADQLRANYNVQQRSSRNWYPLLFWLLETTIVNTYIIMKTLRNWPARDHTAHHKQFRKQLAKLLMAEGVRESANAPIQPASEETSPPTMNVPKPPSAHTAQYKNHSQRGYCDVCRRKAPVYCADCLQNYCCNCFDVTHHESDLDVEMQ